MDLGSVAVIALIAGLAGGAVGAALVGTVEGMLRQRQAVRGSATYGGRWSFRSSNVDGATQRFQGGAPFNDFNQRSRRGFALPQDQAQRLHHSYIGSDDPPLVISPD